MHPEKERIDRILAGETVLFQSLIEDYERLVCHVVYRMVQNEADREELCQECFIKVYKNLKSFRFHSKLSTWIARIAYNLSINHLKKLKVPLYDDITPHPNSSEIHSIDHVASEATDSLSINDEEMHSVLRTEIMQLPPLYRAVVTLYHLDEMSYAEIGEIMDLPDGTVKSYLFRARKQLKDRLQAKFAAEELWS